jgi:glycosyltransferase involved in cell wall biosynthesis
MHPSFGMTAPEKIEIFEPKTSENISPEITILIPALNEEITIGEFLDWCWEGLKRSGVRGEIIIVDSSSDNTPSIALDGGARVLRAPKRGLGQAYIDAMPFIRGQFVIMGDCDLTYDFRELEEFVSSYRSGSEFVMGSRFRGFIEDGAMPKLHRYFGTPLTTWILNKIYRSKYTDIHCGMRGITLAALKKINLTSSGWEYASEMVLKASRIGLILDEVPVRFYKDRCGRLSHHVRSGFWSPWHAGWINLKAMLAYSPDTFLLKPGLLTLFLGLPLYIVTEISIIKNLALSTNTLVLAMTMVVVGANLFQLGIIARLLHGFRNGIELAVLRIYSYNAGMLLGMALTIIGIGLDVHFLIAYVQSEYQVKDSSSYAISGLFFIIIGIQNIGFTLMLELIRRTSIEKLP